MQLLFKNPKTLMLFLILLVSTTHAKFALSACSLEVLTPGADLPDGTIVTSSFAASPTAIRMPKDIDVGSELYRITLRESTYVYYRPSCNGSTDMSNYYTKGQFRNGASPTRSTWQGSSLGVVYATGTAGVGMVVRTSADNKKLGDKLYFRATYGAYCDSQSCGAFSQDADITIILLKTGDISASSVSLSSLPTLESVTGGDNSPGNEITVFRPTLTGSISFTQATCALAESSKTVNLGQHYLESLSAASATTSWVDASIKLINCNYGGAQSYNYNIMRASNSSAVITNANPNTANATWKLTLTPSTSVIDDTNGIMAISSGTGAASGVGIQLSSSNSTLKAMKFSQPTTGTMVSGTNATMTIPLYARYIKTGSTVTAGKAEGKLTYLVEYK